jgi:predicted RNA-binding protein YlqC (UPF0109 family)
MRELLEFLARSLVDDPAAVVVEQFDDDDGTVVLELTVGEDDYGKVIGRGGRVVRAIRSVVRAGAVKSGRRVLVEVDESPATQPA